MNRTPSPAKRWDERTVRYRSKLRHRALAIVLVVLIVLTMSTGCFDTLTRKMTLHITSANHSDVERIVRLTIRSEDGAESHLDLRTAPEGPSSSEKIPLKAGVYTITAVSGEFHRSEKWDFGSGEQYVNVWVEKDGISLSRLV